MPTPPATSDAPPLVLMGEARLDCTIDSRTPGAQKLALTGGGGLEFDAVVSPIVDGTVQLKGPDNGGAYAFTSHLAQPARGKLSGVGAVEITELETKVKVEVQRYQQPGGPGAAFHFESRDMLAGGAYVEFAGVARAVEGNARYGFRVNLTGAKAGSGKVQPADANDNSRMMAKTVVIEAPVVTTIVKTQTTVNRLP
jgi:hypothetical protein